MPSLRIIAILALLAASDVCSVAVSPIRSPGGRRAAAAAAAAAVVADGALQMNDGRPISAVNGPWLYVNCLRRVFSSIQADLSNNGVTL